MQVGRFDDRIGYQQAFGTMRTRMCGLHKRYTGSQGEMPALDGALKQVARRCAHFAVLEEGAASVATRSQQDGSTRADKEAVGVGGSNGGA
jgi:hypothetical protein